MFFGQTPRPVKKTRCGNYVECSMLMDKKNKGLVLPEGLHRTGPVVVGRDYTKDTKCIRSLLCMDTSFMLRNVFRE